MPSADQVPVISAHSTMLWPKWVVLIAGTTGSALRAVRPPNVTSRRRSGANSLRSERNRFSVTLTLRQHRPRHSRELVGQRNGSNLGWAPGEQRREPRPMPGAMDFCVANDRERTDCEQAA